MGLRFNQFNKNTTSKKHPQKDAFIDIKVIQLTL